MRPGMERDCNVIEWIAFASNAFNVLVPFYADIDETPDYLCNTTGEVSTDNFYWSGRMIAAMADASYRSSVFHIDGTIIAATSMTMREIVNWRNNIFNVGFFFTPIYILSPIRC